MDPDLVKQPFGAPGLGEFVRSQPREAGVSLKCPLNRVLWNIVRLYRHGGFACAPFDLDEVFYD